MTAIEKKINRFSIKGLGWVQINEHLISFGHKNIPPDQHFTVSLNGKKDIEFHITKNTSDTKTKPKVPIFVVERDLVNSDLESLFFIFMSSMLKSVDIEHLKKSNELMYVSFAELQKDQLDEETYCKFLNSFSDITKVGKSRIKIDGDWSKRLETAAMSDEMVYLLSTNLREFQTAPKKEIDGGILLNGSDGRPVLKFYDNWFEFKTGLQPKEIFTSILSQDLLNHLENKISEGINFLKTAETKSDTTHFRPIRLIRKPEQSDNNL